MDSIEIIIGAVIFIAALFLVIKIFGKPIKWIFKLLINAGTGYVLLWVVNFFGDFLGGIYIEPNLVNVLISGILGIPGVIILVVYYLYLV